MAKKPLLDFDAPPPAPLDISGLKRGNTPPAVPPVSPEQISEAVKLAGDGFLTTRHIAPVKKMVKDAFAIPEDEYVIIGEMQRRAGLAGRPSLKKVEVIRAALKALELTPEADFLALIDSLPEQKPGPRK